jgi:2-hydroxychromene-2-carboxylate isomerase
MSSSNHNSRGARAVRSLTSWGRLLRGGDAPGDEPQTSESSVDMRALNRAWRRGGTKSQAPILRPDVDAARDHLRGDENAPLVLVEYGDYASPSCRDATAQVRGARARFGSEMLFVFRHFTIADVHPYAVSAAAAAEAAGAQGYFWEMHDRIYRSEFGLEPAATREFAQAIGMDIDRYDSEIADETHMPHLFEDFNSGVASGVNGTPTFYINGARLDWDFKTVSLGDALERALAVRNESDARAAG